MLRRKASCRSDVSRELCPVDPSLLGSDVSEALWSEQARTCKAPGSRLTSLLRFAVLLLMFVSSHAFAETRAWLDRDSIGAGETATLNIETDQATVDSPDYSPLYSDFEVSGNTSSRQFESINGRTRTRVLFAVALRPLRTGDVRIPSLRVGSERTQPLTLHVSGAAPAPARAGGVVFIEAQADATSPYVQQAVGYTVRLYYATSLISGQLDQDPPEGATLQRVGDDLQYQREIDGKRYTVVERRYLLIPERSGTLTIPGARFRGQGMGGFFDDLFGDGRRELSARGPTQTLTVRPVPPNAPQPWLPLRGLELRYVDAPQSARAGEAATVTVEANVDGASATQLPELQLGRVEGAQVFADPPQIEESFDQGRPQVRIVRRFSVVPARAGSLRIPGPSMRWWDVQAGAARTTSLPDIAIDVAPGAAGRQAATRSAPAPDAERSQRWIEVPFVQGAVHPWALATVVFALLWLTTLWWALHRRPRATDTAAAAPAADAQQPAAAQAGLKQALATGDLGGITAALCACASPPTADLDEAAARLDDPAQVAAVRALPQARWGQGDAASALARLREAFARAPAWRRTEKPGKPLLPPLYP